MTLDQLLDLARQRCRMKMRVTDDGKLESDIDPLALAIIDLLGEALDCGIEDLRVFEHQGRLRIDTPGHSYDAREARLFAAQLLRKADEIENQ